MEGGDSSSLGLKQKIKKNRRAWTPREEVVLAELMKELVANGWRSENGFKPGYLAKLENGMKERLPGTDIRWNPHITSRITIWKKFHGSLLTMLHNNSGIGFDYSTGIIDCHDDAWNLIVKNDPNATHMRFKAWPLLIDWNEIFGMDKATGGTAEDVRETVIENEDVNKQNASDLEREDCPVDMDVASETLHMDRATKSKKAGKHILAENSPCDKLCDVLVEINKAADVRMENFVRVIGQQSTLTTAQMDLINLMDELPDFTEDEKVDAAHILARNPECLEMFMGMNMTKRARYARRLLGGQLVV